MSGSEMPERYGQEQLRELSALYKALFPERLQRERDPKKSRLAVYILSALWLLDIIAFYDLLEKAGAADYIAGASSTRYVIVQTVMLLLSLLIISAAIIGLSSSARTPNGAYITSGAMGTILSGDFIYIAADIVTCDRVMAAMSEENSIHYVPLTGLRTELLRADCDTSVIEKAARMGHPTFAAFRFLPQIEEAVGRPLQGDLWNTVFLVPADGAKEHELEKDMDMLYRALIRDTLGALMDAACCTGMGIHIDRLEEKINTAARDAWKNHAGDDVSKAQRARIKIIDTNIKERWRKHTC